MKCKTLSVASVLLLLMVGVGACMVVSDESDAVLTGSASHPLTSIDWTLYYEEDTSIFTTYYVAVGSSVTIVGHGEVYSEDEYYYTQVTSGAGVNFGLTYSNGELFQGLEEDIHLGKYSGTLNKTGTFSFQVIQEDTVEDALESGTITIVVVDAPVSLNVSDMTAIAGSAISLTPVSSGTVTVSGVSWLSATNNVVYGTAPTTPGEYSVSVSCSGSSATFKITVVSALAFSSIPSVGIFAYEG